MIPNCFDERYSYILRFIMNDVLPERIKITEGHTDSTNIYLLGLQKAFDVTLYVSYRGPLYMNTEVENRVNQTYRSA